MCQSPHYAVWGPRPYDSVLSTLNLSFESRVEALEGRIGRAVARAGRERSHVTLVAVSKKFSAEAIQDAYRCGLREFGENYIQEFAGKRPALDNLPNSKYHLIGHLQSN